MTELENIRRTRRHADAGTRGDVETYGAMMSDDIVFHIPGGHRRTPATAAAGFAVVRDDLREGAVQRAELERYEETSMSVDRPLAG